MQSIWVDKQGRREAASSCHPHHVEAKFALLLLFHKKSRSVHLFGCKRPNNGSLSLPIFCEFMLTRYEHSHQTVEIRTLYQSVKGSDFYYILTILILIVNLKNNNIEISGDKTLTGFISFLYIFYPHIRQTKCLLIK